MSDQLLTISQLSVSIDSTAIIKNLDFSLEKGKVHALMGPNGSGKSTLSYTIMGHPSYDITSGSLLFDGENLREMSVDQRARQGIFLAFQYPYEVEGLIFKDFLRQAYNARYAGTDKQIGLKAFKELLQSKMELLGIEESFVNRSLNVGFSGGEKKRAEMLQLAVLQPRLVILDEIDSGLDVDALRCVAESLNAIRSENPEMSVLIITHYQRILRYIVPDYVHVMDAGTIVQSGDASLAQSIEESGYTSS